MFFNESGNIKCLYSHPCRQNPKYRWEYSGHCQFFLFFLQGRDSYYNPITPGNGPQNIHRNSLGRLFKLCDYKIKLSLEKSHDIRIMNNFFYSTSIIDVVMNEQLSNISRKFWKARAHFVFYNFYLLNIHNYGPIILCVCTLFLQEQIAKIQDGWSLLPFSPIWYPSHA